MVEWEADRVNFTPFLDANNELNPNILWTFKRRTETNSETEASTTQKNYYE